MLVQKKIVVEYNFQKYCDDFVKQGLTLEEYFFNLFKCDEKYCFSKLYDITIEANDVFVWEIQ